MNIFDRIEKLCSENGITVSKLSLELGFNKNTIHAWKKSSPSVDKVQLVAHYFGVSTDYLLGLTDNPDPITMVAASHATNPFGKLSDDELAALEAYLDIYRKNKQ